MNAIPLKGQSGRTCGAGDAALLLNEIERFVRRFCVLPAESDYIALSLWAAHTHMVENFYTTPRLAILSPEPGSGKSRVLEILALLVANPLSVVSASSPAIFRTLSKVQATLLFDEVDTVFGKRGKDEHNEELRALLNAGYRRGAVIPRCVGPSHEVHSFDVFAAVALAGLGDLPDTVMTRSVVIRMRPRTTNEPVEPYRMRTHEPQGHRLRDRIAEWANVVGEAVGEDSPLLPPGIVDRPAEVWEPLIAVADAAGDDWPRRAREACLSICNADDGRGISLGVRLLDDLRRVWAADAVALSTETLLARLCGREAYGRDAEGELLTLSEAPWASFRGAELDARGLARLLKQYGVKSKKVKLAGAAIQGYRREDLWDSWERYTPHADLTDEEQVEPTEPSSTDAYGTGALGSRGSATLDTD